MGPGEGTPLPPNTILERVNVSVPAGTDDPRTQKHNSCQAAGCCRWTMGGYTRWCEWHRPGRNVER